MYGRRGLGCIGFTAGVPGHIINSKVTHTCLNEGAVLCVLRAGTAPWGWCWQGARVAVYSSSADEQ